VFLVVALEDLECLVCALEENLLVADNHEVYVGCLLNAGTEVVNVSDGSILVSVLGSVGSDDLTVLDLELEVVLSLLTATVDSGESDVTGSGNVFVFNVCKRPCEVSGNDNCKDDNNAEVHTEAGDAETADYKTSIKSDKTDSDEKELGIHLLLETELSEVGGMSSAIDLFAAMITSHSKNLL
jgi:hypothetical protein